MKNPILALLILASGVAIAQTPAATPATNAKPLCGDVMNLCKAAGFSENGPTGKDIWMNCVGPVISGQTPVKATAQQIAACKADINNQPCSKVMNACKTAGFNGDPKKLVLFNCIIPLTQGTAVPGVNLPPDVLSACKTQVDKQIAEQPCLRIMIACTGAGYSPDTTNGTNFVQQCYLPTMNGQTVTGVAIDSATAAACKKESNMPATPTQ